MGFMLAGEYDEILICRVISLSQRRIHGYYIVEKIH